MDMVYLCFLWVIKKLLVSVESWAIHIIIIMLTNVDWGNTLSFSLFSAVIVDIFLSIPTVHCGLSTIERIRKKILVKKCWHTSGKKEKSWQIQILMMSSSQSSLMSSKMWTLLKRMKTFSVLWIRICVERRKTCCHPGRRSVFWSWIRVRTKHLDNKKLVQKAPTHSDIHHEKFVLYPKVEMISKWGATVTRSDGWGARRAGSLVSWSGRWQINSNWLSGSSNIIYIKTGFAHYILTTQLSTPHVKTNLEF